MVVFSLNPGRDFDLNEHFDSPDKAQLKVTYVYPEAEAESCRMDVLLNTVNMYYIKYGCKVHKIDNPGVWDGYCQFTGGGGGIVIEGKRMTLTIVNQADKVEPDPLLSPNDDKESISSLTIEGKKIGCDNKSLMYQLHANTILMCVSSFLNNCNEYEEAFIRDMEKLSAYGIGYTGLGQVGFYKLEIKFGHPMKFITKLELKRRPEPSAASFVDHALDYFFGKHEQSQ